MVVMMNDATSIIKPMVAVQGRLHLAIVAIHVAHMYEHCQHVWIMVVLFGGQR